MENGYEKEKVKEHLSEKQPRIKKEKNGDNLDHGTVTISYLKGFSEIFKRITSKHGVKTAFRPGTKVEELKSKARTPLGEKKAHVHSILCKFKNNIIGETYRMFNTRKKYTKLKSV